MKSIAKALLEIEAVSLQPNNPFTWSSGLLSPIYCDNRLTLSYPKVRKEIARGLAAMVKEKYADAEVIAGTATAGIPHAAWVSDLLDLPMVYVRGSAKGHGKGNVIEGKVEEGQKVVVIEDLVSTGGSAIEAVKQLEAAGANVLGVAAIFTYGMKKGAEQFASAEIAWDTLTNFDELLTCAVETGMIEEREVQSLLHWRDNPSSKEWLEQLKDLSV
ncbi:orotate phosphoribosyltransferase [Pseudalkalibacillus hwajinpoensis]|uniref:orotate phosphoribosyltransferase n=1 Tax=Guptibacillus hwajinpoensis TaxID=208199 RepID=UPI001CD7C0D3|nr:orotate phosphoribosyltransferase [Pseudalkalibacillus hwajinpoensis]MCA0990166.1 orotate phosphoribosyltransferase [Pseudalkalibacillus hwajinpoensis]